MSNTARFRTQHAELAKQSDYLLACLDDAAIDAKTLRVALNILAGKISLHLAMEDDVLYPRMRAHPDKSLGQLATRFGDEMAGLKSAFLAYNALWGVQKIEADRAGFVKETRAVLSALGTRIQRENTELYARFDAAAG